MLKIVQIQFSGKSAGSSALRLQNGFSHSESVESQIISLYGAGEEVDGVFYLNAWARFKSWVNNKLSGKIYKYDHSKYGLYSYPLTGTDVSKLKMVQEADAIYIHWVQMGFFDFNSFSKLFQLKKRIFIVMHDMWFLTGGCHYAVDCVSYEDSCEKCPIFPNNSKIASSQHRVKGELIANYGKDLQFITPSLWLRDLGYKSSLLKNQSIHFVPNFFSSPHFKSGNQTEARKLLSIDSSKKVICFGAVNISSIYKGWRFLKEAFVHLHKYYSNDEVEVAIFGNGDLKEFEASINFKIHYLGYLEDEDKIALAYKCADVFVIPSILDNQPTTIVESMHCGVPVVGFNLCGIPEMIDHKKNGYIAEAYNSLDLADGIRFCLDHQLDVSLKEEYLPKSVLSAHLNLLN
ncbi:glycosyltransferase involved in cell wall biosynthesis [Algoriphagus sp. 4150]|uniref:glycosyltransferase n=1 Tax=Algoriphagus sp. 4150 TaxID=2817756 RepID=UPI00285E49F3|nr:glycosyltransferase [Algoriphagus sp. 4150]MDR7131769.1 glycosyltransferase involved in cell wall biosynthesis [Algoriphagus sp. 4150]